MDYKFKQGTMAVAAAVVLMVLSVVVIANWRTISNRLGISKHGNPTAVSEAASAAEEALQVAVESGNFSGVQIGNDLYAWMNDENFFDDSDSLEEVGNRIIKDTDFIRPIRDDGTGREER